MFLDLESHTILIAQCQKLLKASESLRSWRASPYGTFLRFSTESTLTEVRRHWSLYDAMPKLPSPRQRAIREAFKKVFTTERNTGTPLSTARAAGPLLFQACQTMADQTLNYRKTGTTFLNKRHITAARSLNPTFAYSQSGEGCALHYGSDPLATFHAAPLFGNTLRPPTPAEVVKSAKDEFSEWCAAFLQSVSDLRRAPRIRFFFAEATAAASALNWFDVTDKVKLNVGLPVAQFRTQLIILDMDEYLKYRAPVSFNVIETSNLVDYIGLLNVLVAAATLMSSSPSSVLYTESLLLLKNEDATKEFTESLYSDVGTFGFLLDLCPIDYLSGFSTRSNTHEIMMHQSHPTHDSHQPIQFHHLTTWKSPASCDSIIALHGGRVRHPPMFDTRQLASFLFDVYHAIFESKDSPTFFRQNAHNLGRAIASANMIHYMREGFVLFLKLVRQRLRLSRSQWEKVMDSFLMIEIQSDETMRMNTVNRNDFYAHLHRQAVYTVPSYKQPTSKKGPFAGWDRVPPVVRIVLCVPREQVAGFDSVLASTSVGTPILQCDVLGERSHNIFTAIHVAYGRAIPAGSQGHPSVIFEDDPEGRNGSCPLVVSFVLSAYLLTDIEPFDNLTVAFSVRSTPGTTELHAKLGQRLDIYRTSLMDREHVQVLPEAPVSTIDAETPIGSLFSRFATLQTQIGKQNAVAVELDAQCEFVDSLTARVDFRNQDAIRDFGSGATPEVVQVSPCVMQLTIAGHVQDVVFPFPVVGSQHKLRLARKSRYIEVRSHFYPSVCTCPLRESGTGRGPSRWSVPETGWHEAQPILSRWQ